ncbi:MAG: amidase family protein, partial [Rhodospirillaceae bacterium]|nr:amidase family protein [Rhodospirillaceae bacterium]
MTQFNNTGAIWQWSAPATAAAIRDGQVSVAEVVNAHIDRMHTVNPALNAVVVDLSDQARAAARKADADRAAGKDLGVLHGVPVTIKINV